MLRGHWTDESERELERTGENWRESSEAHVVSRSFGFLTLAPIRIVFKLFKEGNDYNEFPQLPPARAACYQGNNTHRVSSSYFVGFSSLLDKLSSPSPSSVFVALFVTLLLISQTKKPTEKK